MSKLFAPINLKGITLRNRIAASPMCQYMAVDGMANDWHLIHYGALARGGAGLVVVEATGVSPDGRITPDCLGIWDDAHAEALRPVVEAIKAAGAVPGIQIGHAGRKASVNRPWEGDDSIADGDPRGWPTIAPSPLAFGGNMTQVPREMTKEDIVRVRADFTAAAARAKAVGFEFLMLHFAHGFLAQSFLSPWSNHRTDAYGGSVENRSRFMLETFDSVRSIWPDALPLSMRLGMVEFDGNDDATLAETIELAKKFKARGLDFLDVSMGFSTTEAKIPWGPAMLGDIAGRVRKETGLANSTTWNIATPEIAEDLLSREMVDMVMIGRPLLANPNWPYFAAKTLGESKPSWVLPAPYAHWLERYR